MSLLANALFATALIAVLIVLRLFTDRRSLRLRFHGSRGKPDCHQIGCFRSCETDGAVVSPPAVTNDKPPGGSADHAP